MAAPVPDDEDPRVVAVQAEPVSAVVDAVVGRGVQHQVQRAQARHQLRVDPGTNCDIRTVMKTQCYVWTLVHKIFSDKKFSKTA